MSEIKGKACIGNPNEVQRIPVGTTYAFPDLHDGRREVTTQEPGLVFLPDLTLGWVRGTEWLPRKDAEKLNAQRHLPPANTQLKLTPFTGASRDNPIGSLQMTAPPSQTPQIGVELEFSMRSPGGSLVGLVDDQGHPNCTDTINELIEGQPEAFPFMAELAIGPEVYDQSRLLIDRLFEGVTDIGDSMPNELLLDPIATFPDIIPTLSDTNIYDYVRSIMANDPALEGFVVAGQQGHNESIPELQDDLTSLLIKRMVFERVGHIMSTVAEASPHIYGEPNIDAFQAFPGIANFQLPFIRAEDRFVETPHQESVSDTC
jgi:hypothetical protein